MQIHVEVVQVPLVRAGVVVLFKEGVGQLWDDGVPVNVDDRLVAGLLLEILNVPLEKCSGAILLMSLCLWPRLQRRTKVSLTFSIVRWYCGRWGDRRR